MSVEQIVRMVLPGLQSPKKIESMLKSNIIKSAQFSAMAEISLKIKNSKGKKANIIESTGFSFHKYKQLLGTPYSGATYISYPTGISAAVLLFYTFKSWLKDKEKLRGIIKTEELPFSLENEFIEKIKQKLSSYALDFISHTDSF
ncbi:MAG: hypothetical protein QXH60_03060, partial [Candidatus Pacearchaeota archaeon]